MQTLLLLAIGLAIGTISGALGIGGGVLLVPALIWLCRYDFPKAAGTTLAVLVPPIGLPAAWACQVRCNSCLPRVSRWPPWPRRMCGMSIIT